MDAHAHSHARRARLLSVLLGAAGLLLAACTAAQPPASAAVQRPGTGTSATRSSASQQVREGGQVTVAVTWAGPSAGPRFGVAMDTHSVDLDGIDLTRQAILRTTAGDIPATSWAAPKGGHHRSGELVFPAVLPDGQPTIGTQPVELVIRDVAGIPERTFTWQP